jgi:adenylate kinase family enzyme
MRHVRWFLLMVLMAYMSWYSFCRKGTENMRRQVFKDKELWKNFDRIMIFGRSGSGKSTTSLELHRLIGLPLHHIDRYFYLDRWVERPYEDFLKIQQTIVDQEKWIFDGNGTHSLEIRYPRVQLCLYFNYPRHICYWRAFKRFLRRNEALQDRAPHCPEIFFLWKFIKYIWTFENRVNKSIAMLREKYPHVIFIEIRSDKDLACLEGVLKTK